MNNYTNSSNNSTELICIEYLSTGTIIVLDILYVIIVVVGFCGNVMTCAATIMQKSMRRSIHLYVFNLAVCDLMILTIYVPNEMMRMSNQARFVWGPVMCVVMSTVLSVAVNCTAFTLLAISMDRVRGVLQPFEWRADSQGSARVALPIMWVVAISIAVPVIMHAKLVPWNCGSVCVDAWPDYADSIRYWYTMFAVTFLFPLVMIFILHVIMFYKVNFQLITTTDRLQHQQDNRMMKMIILIVIIFTLCTGSQHFYFFAVVHTKLEEDASADAILFFGSNMLVTVQSACNPIIYGKFREDFNVAYRRMVKTVGKMIRSITVFSTLGYMSASSKSSEMMRNGNVTTHLQLSHDPLLHDGDSSLSKSEESENRNPTFDGTSNRRSSTVDENMNTTSNESEHFGDFLRLMRSPSTNTPKNDVVCCNKSHERELNENNVGKENDRRSSAITRELLQISRLLNELRDVEILDNLTDTSRKSLEFLKLTEVEKNSLLGSYPNVEWLEILHLLRDSEETDL